MVKLLWLPTVLKEAGVKVLEEPGWKVRGREMGTVKGVLAHHTAGPKNGNMPSLGTVRDGRPGLRGPLSQLLLARDGTFIVVAAGRSNHAGHGSFHGISDGNSSLIGIEAENTGYTKGKMADPWPAVQMDAYVKGVAAILDYLKLPVNRAIGHKEWAPNRKIDPTFNMVEFRGKVEEVMAKKKRAIWEKEEPKEVPLELTPEEEVVAVKEEVKEEAVVEAGFEPWIKPEWEGDEEVPVEAVKATPEEPAEPKALPSTAPLLAKQILEDIGWKDYQAAALIAQAMAETGPNLNPSYEGPWVDKDKKVVPKGTEGAQPNGFGIMKWNPERVKHLEWFVNEIDAKENINQIEPQVRFIDWELRNIEKVVSKALHESNDIIEATRAAVGYSKPAGWTEETPESAKDWKDRVIYAYQLMDE